MTRFMEVGQLTTRTGDAPSMEAFVDVYVDAKGYVQNAGFTHQPISALEKGALKGPVAVVLHRTAGATLGSALSPAKSGVGTHFYVDKDGTVHQTASLRHRTHHVGKIKSRCQMEGNCTPEEAEKIRSWGWAPTRIHNHEKAKPYPKRFPMNEDSVGIEVVARCLTHCAPDEGDQATWEPPTPEQAESIRTIVEILKSTYALGEEDVFEHDRISYKKGGEGAGLYTPGGDDE